MDRRTTLFAIGAALPALVTSRASWSQTASGDTVTQSTDGDTVDSGVHPITPATAKLLTLQYGTLSKLTSVLALERSSNTIVREFATYEIIEQENVARALTSTFKPPPAMLNETQHNALQVVKAAPDSTFDTTYIEAQIAGHERLWRIQVDFLSGAEPLTSDNVHISLIAKAFIENHLAFLRAFYATDPS